MRVDGDSSSAFYSATLDVLKQLNDYEVKSEADTAEPELIATMVTESLANWRSGQLSQLAALAIAPRIVDRPEEAADTPIQGAFGPDRVARRFVRETAQFAVSWNTSELPSSVLGLLSEMDHKVLRFTSDLRFAQGRGKAAPGFVEEATLDLETLGRMTEHFGDVLGRMLAATPGALPVPDLGRWADDLGATLSSEATRIEFPNGWFAGFLRSGSRRLDALNSKGRSNG